MPMCDWSSDVSSDLQYCSLQHGTLLLSPVTSTTGSLDWEDPLEKEMATHFSILAWRIPWTGEPGGLPYIGSHDWTRLKSRSTHARPFTLTVVAADFRLFSSSLKYCSPQRSESQLCGAPPTTWLMVPAGSTSVTSGSLCFFQTFNICITNLISKLNSLC